MRRFLAAALLFAAPPALACTPPPPGWEPPPTPTLQQKSKHIFDFATDIVYGVMTSPTGTENLRFKVLHVYKGNLRKGQTISPRLGFGFDPPGCPEMMLREAVPKGKSGVIAFHTEPTLNYVSDERMQAMFDAGWIKSARAGR